MTSLPDHPFYKDYRLDGYTGSKFKMTHLPSGVTIQCTGDSVHLLPAHELHAETAAGKIDEAVLVLKSIVNSITPEDTKAMEDASDQIPPSAEGAALLVARSLRSLPPGILCDLKLALKQWDAHIKKWKKTEG